MTVQVGSRGVLETVRNTKNVKTASHVYGEFPIIARIEASTEDDVLQTSKELEKITGVKSCTLLREIG